MSARPPPTGLEAKLARSARVLWLFDYDGTLVPFAARPELAVPDQELFSLLTRLSRDPRMQVNIVSGRMHEVLEGWFGELPIGLHAEHGLWSRPVGGAWKRNVEVSVAWKDLARPIMEDFVRRTEGALVEEKFSSLAFHYRRAEPTLGRQRARELTERLAPVLSSLPVELLPGHELIELTPRGVNKGLVVPALLAAAPGALVVAAGDDETDERLFRVLPADAWSIRIGAQPTAARFALADVAAMRALLEKVTPP